jgi:hypothetical protein
MSEFFGEHLDLNTIDPVERPIPADMYDLQVRGIRRKTFVYKKGKNAGKDGENVDVRLVVTNHPEHSGRTLRHTFWPSKTSQRNLSALMHTTGVVQDGSFEEWCDEMSTEAPIIRLYVGEVPDGQADPDADGNIPMINVLSWKDIQPASDVVEEAEEE